MRAIAEYLQYLQKRPLATDQESLSDLIQEERALRPMGNSCRFMLLFHGFHLHVMMAPSKCQLPHRQSAWTDTCIDYDCYAGQSLSCPVRTISLKNRPQSTGSGVGKLCKCQPRWAGQTFTSFAVNPE